MFNFKTRHLMGFVVLAAFLLAFPSCLRSLRRQILDTSSYSKNYTESRFMSIRIGISREDVLGVLGNPLRIEKSTDRVEWIYGPPNLRVSDNGGLLVNNSDDSVFTIIAFRSNGSIVSIRGKYLNINSDTARQYSAEQVIRKVGRPNLIFEYSSLYFIYSVSTDDGCYNIRTICFDRFGKVNNIIARWYED